MNIAGDPQDNIFLSSYGVKERLLGSTHTERQRRIQSPWERQLKRQMAPLARSVLALSLNLYINRKTKTKIR